MSEEKQAKPTRQVLLTNDQFDINESGEVVIKSDEVTEAIQSQLAESTPTEAGSVEVGVSVKVKL